LGGCCAGAWAVAFTGADFIGPASISSRVCGSPTWTAREVSSGSSVGRRRIGSTDPPDAHPNRWPFTPATPDSRAAITSNSLPSTALPIGHPLPVGPYGGNAARNCLILSFTRCTTAAVSSPGTTSIPTETQMGTYAAPSTNLLLSPMDGLLRVLGSCESVIWCHWPFVSRRWRSCPERSRLWPRSF